MSSSPAGRLSCQPAVGTGITAPRGSRAVRDIGDRVSLTGEASIRGHHSFVSLLPSSVLAVASLAYVLAVFALAVAGDTSAAYGVFFAGCAVAVVAQVARHR